MTIRAAMQEALPCLPLSESKDRVVAMAAFNKAWDHDSLVIVNWRRRKSTTKHDGILDNGKELLRHPAYRTPGPKYVEALFGEYGGWNVPMTSDGRGYQFLADHISHLNTFSP